MNSWPPILKQRQARRFRFAIVVRLFDHGPTHTRLCINHGKTSDMNKPVSSHDSPGPAAGSRTSILCVSAAVFAATLLPLLLFLRRCTPFAETSVFQPDAFYYLTVARNSLHTPFYSFDGVHPTNGFHPVWQYMLYHAMRLNLLRPDDPFLTLHRLYIGNLVILSIAWALLSAFSARHFP